MLQRQFDCDILISGHTHQPEVRLDGTKIFLNPGSITGAYSGTTVEVTPSFLLLAVQGDKCLCYKYYLPNDGVEFKYDKTQFTKA